MGSLDAFMTTWSNARQTLGEGTPQQGAPFDHSSQLQQMQSTVAAASPGGRWTGSAADSYGDANSRQVRVLGQMAGLDQRLGAEVDRSAAVVAAGRQNLDGVKQWVLDAAASVPAGENREQQLLPIARKGIGDVADVVKQTNGDLNTIGRRIQAIGNEYKALGDPNSTDRVANVVDDAPNYDTGAEIPVGKDSKDVDKWWKSLPPEKRQQLIRDWPEKLGNLNGIPVADRSTANKTIMQQDINRPAEVAQARGVSVDEVLAHPDRYGMAGPMMDRYRNALEVQKGLDYNSSQTHQPTFLYVYDPEEFGGKGRAAIAIGDPDKAANTAVVVPGTSHSVAEGWLSQKDAANVYNETQAADKDRSTSVIAWMGYDAPNSLADPQVGQTGLAHRGGAWLASDVSALSATHDDAHVPLDHVTVIGHSYGSTTVADAAAGYGMRVNDVVLVGCPGTDMAKDAAAFNLAPGGHVYVGGASGDAVSYFGGIGQEHIPGTDITVALGNDPYVDGFGSTRFKAENPSWGLVSDHSHYFDKDSESLFSIGDIASGHGDALQHDGMTAQHRVRIPGPLPLPEIDPEAAREARGRTHQ